MNNDRAAIRRELRARRAALSEAEQESASQAVFKRIKNLPAYQSARVVMAYAAARGELELTPVFRELEASGRTLLLPRCTGEGQMEACVVRGPSDLVPGKFGIAEPKADCPVFPPEDIDLVLVPGTAFDRRGGRIGQGGGYYDRFLPKTQAVFVGVCHDFALFKALPQEIHDVRMHVIVTPNETTEDQEDER